MRPKRSETLKSGYSNVIIAHALSEDSPSFTLKEREVIRQYLYAAKDLHRVKVLSWVILPRSYRLIIRSNQQFDKGAKMQNTPLVDFMKSFQQRVSMLKNLAAGRTRRWTSRYRSVDISTSSAARRYGLRGCCTTLGTDSRASR